MRIIAGDAGGISLQVPAKLTRPTTDRVREAVFSSLGSRVPGAHVLDLYAGSGALGLEALSRGAQSAVFVDEQRHSCETVADNLRTARLSGAEIVCQKVLPFLRKRYGSDAVGNTQRCGLVFADPPYGRDGASREEICALFGCDALLAALQDDGVFVFESLARVAFPDLCAERWQLVGEKRYGDTQVSYWKARSGVGTDVGGNPRREEGAS